MKVFNNVYAATLIASALTACGGGGGGTVTPVNSVPSADFDAEVFGHQSWSALSPVQQRENMPTGVMKGPFAEIVGTSEYNCTSDEYSLTDSPKELIAIDPDVPIMWLGNLIQGDSHLKVGSLAELSIDERAPININIDLLIGDNSRRVTKPSLTTVNAAIGDLVANAVAVGHEASSNVFFTSKEAHSTVQTSLDLGFTAEYLGGSAEGSLSVDKQGNQSTFFAYFLQDAFTVSMELPTSPHDMVTDDFSQSALDDLKRRGQIADNNPPLYISSMTYGRVLIYKMTSSYESSRIQAALSASYNGLTGGGGGYSEAELRATLAEAKIEIASFGGNQASVEALIRSGQLRDYFTGDTKLTSMTPISFELRNLQDNTIAEIARTTNYDLKKCAYVGDTRPPVGETIKIYLDRVRIPFDCDGGIDKGDIFGRFDVISHNPSNNSDFTRRMYTIARDKNVKVGSGNDLNLSSRDYTINKYYGKTFRISAQLKDADGGANGADDIVGNWNANQFGIAGLAPGSYSKRAVSNCGDKQPTLYYRLERVGYIY